MAGSAHASAGASASTGTAADAAPRGHRGSTPGRKKYSAEDSKIVALCYVELTSDPKTGLPRAVEDLAAKLEKSFNETTCSHQRVGKNLIQHWGVLNRDCRAFEQVYAALVKASPNKSEEELVAEANAQFSEKHSRVFKFEDAWHVLKDAGRVDKADGFERIKRTPITKDSAAGAAAAGSAAGASASTGGKRKRARDDVVVVEDGSSGTATQNLSAKLDLVVAETTKVHSAIKTMASYSSTMAELAECREWVTMTIPSDLDAESKASLKELKAMGVARLPKLIEKLAAARETISQL